MRLDTSNTKMTQQEDRVDEVAEVQEKLSKCSIAKQEEAPEENANNESDAEDRGVEAVTAGLNDLSVQPEAAADERLERGPDKNKTLNRLQPYNTSIAQNHLSGSVYYETKTVSNNLSEIVPPTYPYDDLDSIVPSLEPSELPYDLDAYQEMAGFLTQNPVYIDNFVKNAGNNLGITVCDEVSPHSYTTSMPISMRSPKPSPVSSDTSGYLSSTSSPSQSPPRSVELPEPIQAANINNQKQLRPILPKFEPKSDIQKKLHCYIMSYGRNNSSNDSIFTRTKRLIYNNTLNPLKRLVSPLTDGDTILTILVANKLAVKSLIANCGYSEEQEEVFRLSFIYNLVAYISVEQPDALETKNDQKQSVLHLAARNCNEHPLMAAYIAEALEIHNKQHLLEICTAEKCPKKGTGNLLHCLAQMGNSHADVLRHLLEVKSVKEIIEITCQQTLHQQIHLLPPLHLAILAETRMGVHSSVDTVKALLDAGARVSKNMPKNVNSALHYALTGTPSYKLVDLLLRERGGGEANVPDLEENHPLMTLALNCGSLSEAELAAFIKMLMRHGATIKKMVNVQLFFAELRKKLSDVTYKEVSTMLTQ